MKCILTILIFIAIVHSALGQVNTQNDIDTLKKFEDKTLVIYRIYKSEILSYESTAYFYPVIHKIPRFKLMGNLFKVSIEVDSIVRHGTTKKYLDNRNYKVTEYSNGKKISSKCFSIDGTEISENEFQKDNGMIGPCGEILGEYYVSGKKKSKKKSKKNDN